MSEKNYSEIICSWYPKDHYLVRNSRLVEIALEFMEQKLNHRFTELEAAIIKNFFTNTNNRVFFVHSLAPGVIAALMAMYSRLKNPRGIRGLFVDTFLPQIIASFIDECEKDFDGNGEKFLKAKNIKSLEGLMQYPECRDWLEVISSQLGPIGQMLERIASADKVKKFLSTWLDRFGHNSIARVATIWLGVEGVSLLTAKSIEWTRPGSGYIELSTRYVDMSGKDFYPIEKELELFGVKAEEVRALIEQAFDFYRQLQGENFSGPFPNFLRKEHQGCFPDAKDLETGVIGETCDVLGNFLPAATLTSLGVAISGESLPQLMKHLILDSTPENAALAFAIYAESHRLGIDQFMRHFKPTKWEWRDWEYLDEEEMAGFSEIQGSKLTLGGGEGLITKVGLNWANKRRRTSSNFWSSPETEVNEVLLESFRGQRGFKTCKDFDQVIERLLQDPRESYDKLPGHFENISAFFEGVMSFRSWRDLQRQGFCSHRRTYLTPNIGFYLYDKPAPEEFFEACRLIHGLNRKLFLLLKEKNVPPEMIQYPLSLGNIIGFQSGANLRQWEFCIWQRTKYSVNHEVRQIFLEIENMLRTCFSWWQRISRADTTKKYIFARTKEGVPLSDSRQQ